MLKRQDVRIRDPFILVENGSYYMYGTNFENKFYVYESKDLENFDGPFVVFDGEKENFWADRDFWAPEVWKYKDKFYLFGSFKSATHKRASQILVSDNPLGQFKTFSDGPVTPEDMECLDGTFYEEDGVPYMVFCHEWVQCVDGEIRAVRLKRDLSGAVGDSFLLFKASENPYVCAIDDKGSKVTDGPFLFREKNQLNIIWSSFVNGKYTVLKASSDGIKGKWKHFKNLFDIDGGHAMMFTNLQGGQVLALHSPNNIGSERAVFIPCNRNIRIK